MVDIRTKNCIDCDKKPSFNFSGEKKAIYCADHKKENMIVVNSKKCQHAKCKDVAFFGFSKKQFCNIHKQPNMVNLVLENKCNILDCGGETAPHAEGLNPYAVF